MAPYLSPIHPTPACLCTAKTLARQAEKYAKKSKQQKAKIKAMLAKGDLASARIYGENAIQAQAQYKNLLGLSSKLDGVASRIQSAQATKNMQPLMKKTVQGIACEFGVFSSSLFSSLS